MYRFYVILNSITRQVNPINSDKLSIVNTQEAGQIFKRKKLNGSPIFKGDDFLFFQQIENSFSRCSPVTFQIHKKCSGVYSQYWEGQFGMNSGKFDPDKGVVEFEIEPLDDYTDILKEAKTKINILNLPATDTVQATISGYYFEYADCSGFTTEGPAVNKDGCKIREGLQEGHDGINIGSSLTPPRTDNWTNCTSFTTDEGWVPYRVVYQKAIQTNILPSRYVHQFQVKFIREYRRTPDVDGDPVSPPGTWINLGQEEVDGFIYTRWARTPFGDSSYLYTWSLESGCILSANVQIDTGTVDTFDRNRSFNTAMEYLVASAFGVNIISDFFSLNGDDTYDPDNWAYQKAKANLSNLLIAQKSDIKNPYSSEPARKGELTFEGLQEIWKIFHCAWKVIEGDIRVEHVSYWENTGLIDLTTSDYEKYTRRNNAYEYEKETLAKKEEFKFMEESVNDDFTGLPIEYDSICVNQDPESNSTLFQCNVTTDISFIRVFRDTIANDGFVLIVHDGAGNISSEAGLLTSITMPNMHLSWANLHYNYHRWERVLDIGTMNGATTTFLSSKKTKKQIAITIPQCCLNINDTDNIKTFIGTGSLLSMEENLYTGTAKIEVIHSIGELTGSVEDRQFDDSFDLSFN